MNEEALVFQELEEGNKDIKWLNKNYSDLQKAHSNKFIAIKNEEIFIAKKLEELIELLKKEKKEPSDYLIDFIYSKGESLVV